MKLYKTNECHGKIHGILLSRKNRLENSMYNLILFLYILVYVGVWMCVYKTYIYTCTQWLPLENGDMAYCVNISLMLFIVQFSLFILDIIGEEQIPSFI